MALTSLDGVIKYTTQACKDMFQYFNPADVIGQNISYVLKEPHLLETFRSNAGEGFTTSSDPIELELVAFNDIILTARVSPTNIQPNVDKLSRNSISSNSSSSPSRPLSSLSQAFQSQAQQMNTCRDDEEELSFNDCFNDAAVEHS